MTIRHQPFRLRRALLVLAVAAAAVTAAGPPVAAQEQRSARQGNEAADEDWVSVTAGGNHTCGIRSSGRLYCWGQDFYGQLGDGGANTNRAAPVEVAGGRTDWVSVTAGGNHTCARTAGKRSFCWGSGLHGQLGDNQIGSERAAPVEVAGGRTDWVSVTAGGNHTCARTATRRLYCWGSDASGQVGDSGANTNRAAPRQVYGGRTDWVSVTAGGNHTCARTTARRLYCWGSDASGQVGDSGANTNRAAPVQVAGRFADWVSVTAGGNHTCARTRAVYCWGYDYFGQVGDGGANTNRAAPVQVAGGPTDWVAVSSGGNHTCGQAATGRLYCWGYDYFGQVGDGGANTNRAAPVEVAA